MVEHWLNVWGVERRLGVRFEVINAARPGSGALDAAAIFQFELGAIDPDYVILYGFGNGMDLSDAVIKLPPGVLKGQPASAAARTGVISDLRRRVGATLEPWAHRSAAAAFLRSRVQGPGGGRLPPEPANPVTR